MAGSFRLEGGMGTLIKSIKNQLVPESLSLNQRVTALHNSEDGIRASCTSTDNEVKTIYCDLVILALPPRVVAERIDFSPTLPINVSKTMKRIPTWMAGQAKITAVYDRPYHNKYSYCSQSMNMITDINMLKLTQRSLSIVLSTFSCLTIVACNTEFLEVSQISQTELFAQIETKKPLLILDVRSKKEYDEGHIPGAVNIEFRELKDHIDMIASFKDAPVVIYCERGIRAAIAEKTLQNEGFKTILYLEGHMPAWRKNSLPIEKSER